MAEHAVFRQAVDQFSDWRWRLNNLYHITDKDGRRSQFRLNWAQEALFEQMHYMNVILKARQLGFTTFIQIFMLDAAIFNANIRAGTIAHTLLDAQTIFRDKVKYPYDNLPEQLKEAVPVVKDSATELMLANNSSIRVGTSLRSGTLQYLHVSEYGKLCAKYPDKAREVRTGALNTVQAGQIVFIESTAEGQEGHFFELSETARSKQNAKTKLTPLDFKFFFFPWWREPEYILDPAGVVIPQEYADYFDGLKETAGITLTAEQKAWYVKKAETQLDDMKREYPSTPKEAFEASVEGAYYGKQLETLELKGKIGDFPALPGIQVDTAWDLGVSDYTAIWFFQRVTHQHYRFVGYLENSGEGLPYYLDEIEKMAKERGWTLSKDLYWPHDGRMVDWGSGKSRIEQARERQYIARPVVGVGVADGINAVRAILPNCEFDAAACSVGLKHLKAYRKEWDDERAVWRDRPRHDLASHGADAFRTFASRYRDKAPAPEKPKPKKELIYTAQPDGRVLANMSVAEIVAMKAKKRKRR